MRLIKSLRLKGAKFHICRESDDICKTGLCGAPLPFARPDVDESTVAEEDRCISCYKFYDAGSI